MKKSTLTEEDQRASLMSTGAAASLRRSVCIPRARRANKARLRQRMRDIAMSRPRLSYLRVMVMPEREGW